MMDERRLLRDDSDEMERRSFEVEELRVVGDGVPGEDDRKRIEGYAAVFGQLSEEMWGFRELIEPGAFSQSIQEDDVRALWNHNAEYPLGRNTAGTLDLTEDERGLRTVIYPPDTSYANDLVESIDRGDVTQMSFGFVTLEQEWHEDKEKEEVTRRLLRVKLFDVSPVTFPAYPQTSVAVRERMGGRGKGNRETGETGRQGIEDLGTGEAGQEPGGSQPSTNTTTNIRMEEAGEAGQEPGESDETGEASSQVRMEVARRKLEIEEVRL